MNKRMEMMVKLKPVPNKKLLKLPQRLRNRNAHNKSNANRRKSNAAFKKKRRTPELRKRLRCRDKPGSNRSSSSRPLNKPKSKNVCSSCKTELMTISKVTKKRCTNSKTSAPMTEALRENWLGKLKR